MNEYQLIMIASIVVKSDFQTRAEKNEDAITEYVQAIQQAGRWPFPPIKVVSQFLVDGFHRLEAAKRVIAAPETTADLRKSLQSIPCERVEVDLINDNIPMLALQHSLAANQTHGLMRTNADKKRAVSLAFEAWPDWSDREIAKLTGTSHTFVSNLRKVMVAILPDRSEPSDPPEVAILPDRSEPSDPPEVATLPDRSEPDDPREVAILPDDSMPPKKQRASCTGDEPTTDPEDAAKKLKSLAHQHRDKLAVLICDYANIKRNNKEQTRLVKLVQSVQLW